jgi:hypothetical protein
MKKKKFLLTMCLLTFLVACGSDDDSKDDIQEEEDVNQETQGLYEASLVPLNTGVAGSTVGSFQIRILGDEVRVRGEVENSPPVFHRQFIHTGANCPGPGADTNIDGNLDFNESENITGPALVPLDRNLSTQKAGYIFPVPGALGAYTYFETTSLVRMMADLHSEDPDPSDTLTKLDPDQGLNLSGRTIVIYGVRGNSNFPIACGTIARSVEPLPDGPVVKPPPPSRHPRRPPHRPPPAPLPPLVPWDDFFSTLLSPDLQISGRKCHGGERTDDNWICRTNQWMVTIDNETDVGPFIAHLVLQSGISTNQTAYYTIRPVSRIDDETFVDAREHWVRFDRNGSPVVLRKPER